MVSTSSVVKLKGLLDIGTFATQNLSTSATDPSGGVIGTARVRFVEEDGSNFRVYLFDIKMNSGQSLRNVKTVGTNSTNRAVLVLENSKAVIKESQKVNLIYPLPQARPKSLTDFDFEVQRIVTGTSGGSGSLTLTALTVTGETWANTSDWIITRNDTGCGGYWCSVYCCW